LNCRTHGTLRVYYFIGTKISLWFKILPSIP